MPALVEESFAEVLGAVIFKIEVLDELGQPHVPGGPIKETGGRQFQACKAYVQHRQEQTAKVHIVRKGGGNNSEEEQGQNFRHGAEYWKSVD